VLAGVDEGHREQTRERVHEAHARAASQGYCVGNRVFGYRNVDVVVGNDQHGRPIRSHVDRVIYAEEAAVVRRIFALYAEGYGLKNIVTQLTLEGAVFPTPFKRKDPFCVAPVRGWTTSTVHAILRRDLYHGIVVWNKTKKRTQYGKVRQRPRPESEWKRAVREDLRIVPEDLWQRTAAARQEKEGRALRLNNGILLGRPPKHGAFNLLAGLATYGDCGGGLVIETSKSTAKKPRKPHYMCHRHRDAGGVCPTNLRVPVEDVNEEVLQAIERHALTPAAIEEVIRLSQRDELSNDATRSQRSSAT
jgi:site-specific DNA recombinase